jgi:DNA polymerase V
MYALVDCNSFYCSCERVFKPDLRTRPVLVLSNNDGCVIARTNEVKALGIPMGAPAHSIKQLVAQHNIAVFSSNYALYGDMSARVMSVLGQFTPEMEVYSIDEAFLNLEGFEHLDLAEYGKTIIKTTTQSTGIPVSIGIAKTKTLAKLANKLAKKIPENKGVCVLDTEGVIETALKIFPIEDVWGIGRQHAKRLLQMNIKTAHDFIQLPRVWVQSNMTVVGVRMWEELRGQPCYDLELTPPTKKNICTSRSFGQLLDNISDIEEAVATHAANCGEKLRRQKSCATILTVFIATNPFRPTTPQYANSISINLEHPTNDSAELISAAKRGLKQIFRKGYWYKKAGIIVSELTPENTTQTNLFRHIETDEKHQKLMHVLDGLNGALGRNTVKFAAQGQNKRGQIKQEKLSGHYTTQLKDIFWIKT